jgi:hypothetical protein
VRYLRLVAWGVFFLDVVVLAQLGFNWLTQRGGPEAMPAVRGLTVMLGSALAGIAVLLIVSARMNMREGLWIALALGLVPLLWSVNAIFESLWE